MQPQIWLLRLSLALTLIAFALPVFAQGPPAIIWARAGIDYPSTDFAVSPDASLVVVAHRQRLRILHTATGLQVRSFLTGSAIQSVVWTTDGALIVTRHFNQLRVWDPNTGGMVRSIATTGSDALISAVSPSVVFVPGSPAELWDVTSGIRASALPPLCGEREIAMTGTGLQAWAWCRSDAQQARVVPALFDLATGVELRRVSTTFDFESPIAISPGGSMAAIGLYNGLRIVRTTDWTTLINRSGVNRYAPAWSSDGSHVIRATETAGFTVPGRIEVVRVSDATVVRSFDPEDDLGGTGSYRFKLLPNGTLVTNGEVLRRWSTALSTTTPFDLTVAGPLGVTSLLWTNDGTRVVSTTGTDGRLVSTPRTAHQLIRVWNAADGTLLRSIDNGAPVTAAALVADSDRLVTISATDQTMKLFDIRTGAHHQTLNLPTMPLHVATSPDGRYIAVSYLTGENEGGRVALHSPSDLSLVRQLTIPALQVTRVAFSPDSSRLAAAAGNNGGGEHGFGAPALVVWALDGRVEYVRRLFGVDRDRSFATRGARDVAYSQDGVTIALIGITAGVPVGPVGGGGWLRKYAAADGTLLGGNTYNSQDTDAVWYGNEALLTGGFGGIRLWRQDAEIVTRLFDDEVGATTSDQTPQIRALAVHPFTNLEFRFAYALTDGTVVVAHLPATDSCVPDVQVDARSFGAAGGVGNIHLQFPPGTNACPWTASAADSWLSLSTASGFGSTTIAVTAAALSSSASRTGSITIAGNTITFAQAGTLCRFDFVPAAFSVGPAAQQLSVNVTTGPTCLWTASHYAPWLLPDDTRLEYGSQTGSWTARLSLAANRSGVTRTHAIVIGGQRIPVSQSGACSITISPTSAFVAASGSTGTINVAAQSGCAWTATTTSPWLSLSRTAGSGAGQITWTASINPGPQSRAGIITIAGQVVMLTQEGSAASGAPNPPRNLDASVTGATVILLWLPPTDGPAYTTYFLEVGTASGLSDLAATAIGSVVNRYVASDVPNGTYYIRVRAANAAGRSSASNEVIVRVGADLLPSVPTGLAATITGSAVTLAWSAPSSGGTPTSYILDAGNTSGSSNLASFSTATAATLYTAVGVPDGTYYLRVRAANAHGVSGFSNEVEVRVPSAGCAAPPGPPGGLADVVTGLHVVLSWNAPAAGDRALDYRLEVGSAPGLTDLQVLDIGSSATTFEANGSPGTFHVRVRGTNACGIGPPSNNAVVVIRP